MICNGKVEWIADLDGKKVYQCNQCGEIYYSYRKWCNKELKKE